MHDHIAVLETTRKIFRYGNGQNWQGLLDEVFAEQLTIQNCSIGKQICDTNSTAEFINLWKGRYSATNKIYSESGIELISVDGGEAHVHSDITQVANQFLMQSASKELIQHHTFETYLNLTSKGWRIYHFKANKK